MPGKSARSLLTSAAQFASEIQVSDSCIVHGAVIESVAPGRPFLLFLQHFFRLRGARLSPRGEVMRHERPEASVAVAVMTSSALQVL